MKRNLIVLGLAGMLMIGLSLTSFAGIVVDADGDGVSDDADNCLGYANGALASEPGTPSCDAQEDGDGDGYGNPCDRDPNNDGGPGLDDVGDTFTDLVNLTNAPQFDYNCDGGTGLDDVGTMFDNVINNTPPGPSGYACAGTVPCP